MRPGTTSKIHTRVQGARRPVGAGWRVRCGAGQGAGHSEGGFGRIAHGRLHQGFNNQPTVAGVPELESGVAGSDADSVLMPRRDRGK